MSRLLEITDWGLADELAHNRPAVLVALIHRLVPNHRNLMKSLAARSEGFGPLAAFRVIDIGENPSLIIKLCLKRLPAVILYTHGAEHQRWWGPLPLDEVMETLAYVLQSREGA